MDLSYLCNLRECRISTIATVNCGLFYMIKTILIKDIARFVLNILFSTLCIIFLLNIMWYIGPLSNLIKIFISFWIHILRSDYNNIPAFFCKYRRFAFLFSQQKPKYLVQYVWLFRSVISSTERDVYKLLHQKECSTLL